MTATHTTRVSTPKPDHINAQQLAANLLALAGYGHPTHEFIIDSLELIADALDIINPDDDEHAERAEDLAAHFRQWASNLSLAPTSLDTSKQPSASITGQTHALVPLQALHGLRLLAATTRGFDTTSTSGATALRNAAENLPVVDLQPIRVAVSVEGGVVQGGALDSQLGVSVVVIDYDTNDHTDPAARPVRQQDGSTSLAWVYDIALGQPTINLDDVFGPAAPQSLLHTTDWRTPCTIRVFPT